MARLPQPGGDRGNWGDILNNYLVQSHNSDGSLKDGIVTADKLADDAVTEDALGAGTATDGQVLTRDTSEASGLSWTTPSSGATNLSTSSTANNVTIVSSTGVDAVVAGVTTSDAGVMTSSDKTKLDGIQSSATANDTNANLRDRTTHTGVQPISSVTNLQTSLDAKANTSSLATVATSGDYDDLSDKPTIPRITASSTAPGSPQVGDMWIDLSS